MKKLIALIMALAMVMSLVACGSSSSSDNSSSDAAESPAAEESAATESEAAEEPAESEAAESEAAEESTDETDFTPIDCDPLQIQFSTTYNQTETGGQIILDWIDALDRYSNGNITVDVMWGGTVYSDADVLDALESGAINMTTFGHMPHTGTLNYLAFPGFAPGGTQAALDYFNELCFDDPETSALIQGELAEHNIIFFNVLPGGANAFCTTYEFTDLASLISGSSSFGNMDAVIFEKLGLQVTSIEPGSCYDALQRGMIDGTQMGLTPMVSMQWYDVAPYWALDGTYTAGNFISANLDWFNGLTEDQQSIIRAASKYAEVQSAEVYSADIEGDVATVEEATGNKFVEFSDEDIATFWAAVFEAKADAAMTTANANGKGEGMETILNKAAELTGYDWSYQG
jgi:TRAP-type C4-dicarboxylate transport system substrate-binding protein